MADSVYLTFPSVKEVEKRQSMKEWKCHDTSKYEKIVDKGSGAFGKVFKSTIKNTNQLVALKQIKFNEEKNKKEGFPITAMREIILMKQLNHKNILSLKEIVVSPKKETYLVFEYMDFDFLRLINDHKIKFKPEHVKNIMYQILQGMKYLHEKRIVHRDIKCANILINKKGEVKIGDFGLARIISKENKLPLTPGVVTLWYKAPELLLNDPQYNFKIDIWSIGCVFSELLTGEIGLFHGNNDFEQLDKIFLKCGWPKPDSYLTKLKNFNEIKKKLKDNINKYRYTLSEDLKNKGLDSITIDLLIKMLELDPNKRINIDDAINHDYFKNEPKMCDSNEIPFPKTDENNEINLKNNKINNMNNNRNELKIDDMKIGENEFHNNNVNNNGNNEDKFLNKKRNKEESSI